MVTVVGAGQVALGGIMSVCGVVIDSRWLGKCFFVNK